MRTAGLTLTIAISVALGGCATRPLPEDVTHLSTTEIVRKIRCEMRDAVEHYAILAIGDFDPGLANDLQSGRVAFADLANQKLAPAVAQEINTYRGTVVAYEFTFDITETNTVQANAGIARIFDRGPFSLGFDASSEKQRENVQNFRIIDSFENLATLLPASYCDQTKTGASHAYPITGKLGLEKTVGTFLELNQTGNLAAPSDKKKLPAFAETITFTTTISGDANPTVKLAPLASSFNIASAGVDLSAEREDVHELVVVLTLRTDQSKPLSIAEERLLDELDRQEQRELIGVLGDLSN